MSTIQDILPGSKWSRIITRYVWTVERVNPNGSVSIFMGAGEHRENETHPPEVFLGAFREVMGENPLASVHEGYGRVRL